MKHKIPIRLTNRTDNSLLSGTQIQFMMRMLLLLVFVFSAMDISAQAAASAKRTAPSQSESSERTIVHLDQFLSGLQNRASESTYVKGLLYDVQPSAYLEAGSVKTYGDNPTNLFTDASSFAGIGSVQLPATIEIVTVKFKNQNDLTKPLNLSVLSAFPRLRYVYLLSEVKATGGQIVSIVKNVDPRYSVFYNSLISQ